MTFPSYDQTQKGEKQFTAPKQNQNLAHPTDAGALTAGDPYLNINRL